MSGNFKKIFNSIYKKPWKICSGTIRNNYFRENKKFIKNNNESLLR